MDNAKIIIAKTEDFVKQSLANHDGSHDTQHIWRVRQTALDLAREEGADLFVVELAALLHDIGDYKYNPGGDQVALVSDYLKRVGVDAKVIDQVTSIIDHMGFKSSLEKKSPPPATPEFACVQDADRLDAIGAIGIARCIAYGGSRKGAIYVPGASANAGRKLTAKEYGSTSSDAVTHFYDKLLKVRDRMGTVSGTREASHRHDVMINFLRDLGKE
ncbi:metal dependent phosphohydrolase, partial [Cladochytrium replicatum]